jgi:two-component system, LytTR family, sensor kinase
MKLFKYNFWTFQLAGWFLFCCYDIWSNPLFTTSWSFFFFWFRSMIILFLLTLLLRIISRWFYNNTHRLFNYLIFAFISSFIFSYLWMEIREFISVTFDNNEVLNKIPIYTNNRLSIIFLYRILFSTWVFLVWNLLYFGIKYWQDLFTERVKAREAMILAQKAQLQMLRNQLNPHFLFNSLNSIQGLIYENPDLADSMISELSEFLRYSLQYNTRTLVTVNEELEILKKYLSIEKIRYEERLEYVINSNHDLIDHEIPSFISQPLVENSIKHGLLNNPAGIIILVNVYCNDNFLTVEVTNTGTLSSGKWSPGTGISNIKERLEKMYPGRNSFSLLEEGGMVTAKIKIPLSNEKIFSSDNR